MKPRVVLYPTFAYKSAGRSWWYPGKSVLDGRSISKYDGTAIDRFSRWNEVPPADIYLQGRAVSAKISFSPRWRKKMVARMSDLHNLEGVPCW